MAALATVLLWPRLPRAATRPLSTADEYELLSIAPDFDDAAIIDDYHRHRVLGHVIATDPAVRERLNAALRSGVAPTYNNRPNCFSPRLGIRVTGDGRTTDFVICFGCKQAQVWQDGQFVTDWTTDRTPKAAFDHVLQSSGVHLPPDD